MSRLVASGFVLLDVSAGLATLLHTPTTLAILFVSAIVSIGLALMSATVPSLIWPTYFWDQPHAQPATVRTGSRTDYR